MCKFDFWSSESSDLLSSLDFGQVTDRHTYIQKVMHKSQPCIRTGGLKKGMAGLLLAKSLIKAVTKILLKNCFTYSMSSV